MWFASSIKNPVNIMVEPDPHKMNFGKLNFIRNGLRGVFDLGFIDQHTNLTSSIPSYSVDYLMNKHRIEYLHILHSDIQGYEFKMLHGATESFKNNKIGYVFISTHSNELHDQCRAFLTDQAFEIICSANLDETYSWDGLLVARSRSISGTKDIVISRRGS
jgi:hypothetical protein